MTDDYRKEIDKVFDVNRGKYVCPICGDYYKVGTTFGLAFCGECGFQSHRANEFLPSQCPTWVQKINYIERLNINLGSITTGEMPNLPYNVGDYIHVDSVPTDKGSSTVGVGWYIVVSHTGGLRVQTNSMTPSSIMFFVAPVKRNHLNEYKILSVA